MLDEERADIDTMWMSLMIRSEFQGIGCSIIMDPVTLL
jgi:hypothetical protein